VLQLDAYSLLARQVVIKHFVRKLNELPIAAIGTFDARLLTNTREPFVGAGW